jgi:cytochrome c peroxidase/DNA-binding beta-propeller fold protein YncE
MRPIALLLLLATGCASRGEGDGSAPANSALSTSASLGSSSSSGAAPESPAPEKQPLLRREGQALVASPDEKALYLADEDHAALRRIALTPELTSPPAITDPPAVHFGDAVETRVDLPGRPAQVFVTADQVFVTVRDPGHLVVFSTGEAPKEIYRVPLPADAWGLALSPGAESAFVTSAWTHKLTKIDLGSRRVAWSVDVAREPRGVTVSADGKKVYVTHLVGADLTRVDVTGDPKVDRVSLPADPLRTLAGDKTVTASLGYAAILSPDGSRLFAARHALGALWEWQGNSTVDILSTKTDEPLVPVRGGKPFGQLSLEDLQANPSWADHAGAFAVGTGNFVQPRAIAYRKKTNHLLIASEGRALLAELDAMSMAPGLIVNRYYRLGGLAPREPTKIQIPPHCGAPTGIALSPDEAIAWVYCRTTDNIAAVRLTPDGERAVSSERIYIEGGAYLDKLSPWGPFAYARLAVPASTESFALGRRLFFDANEPVVSGEMGCAGCHPDGRDDGHVWRELEPKYTKFAHFRAGPTLARATSRGAEDVEPYGFARQTPMLAGRVRAVGPYGWHGESPTLVDRIKEGFELHRENDYMTDGLTLRLRAEPIAEFLRSGLVPPPREDRELTDVEREGKAVFDSPKTGCLTCHVPASEFTDRSSVPLAGFKTLPFFTEDPRREYKVPSLLYVGGTPPYYHDGSAASLEELVEQVKNRMGRTTHLSAGERAALVAYLKTL